MKRLPVFAGAIMAGLFGSLGCESILGLKRADLYNPDAGSGGEGGGGTSSTTTSSGTAGSGGSVCVPGATMPCYTGPAGTADIGICQSGVTTCKPDGSGFEGCVGMVLPQQETCAAPVDEDCSGHDCVQWAKLLGDNSIVDDVAIGTDGSIVLVGTFSGAITWSGGSISATANGDLFVLKLNAGGTPLWGKAYSASGNSAFVTAVAVDPAGDIIIAGKTVEAMSFGGPAVPPGIFTAKVSKDSGQEIWSHGFTVNYEGAGLFDSDYVRTLAVAPNGDVLVGGTFSSSINFGDGMIPGPSPSSGQYAYLARLSGSTGWGQAAEGGWVRALCTNASRCEVGGVAVDGSGAILLAADFDGTLDLSSSSHIPAIGAQDMVLAKLTATGSVVWQRQIAAAGSFGAVHSLSVDGAGGPVLAGSFSGALDFGAGVVTASQGTGFVAHYGPDKTYAWSRMFANDGAGRLLAVAATTQGGAFVAGRYSESFDFGPGTSSLVPSGAWDVFVARFNEAGMFSWARGYGGPLDQEASSVALTSEGDPVIVGNATGPIDFGAGVLTPNGGITMFVAKLSR